MVTGTISIRLAWSSSSHRGSGGGCPGAGLSLSVECTADALVSIGSGRGARSRVVVDCVSLVTSLRLIGLATIGFRGICLFRCFGAAGNKDQ